MRVDAKLQLGEARLTLHENYPYSEFFFVPNAEKYRTGKVRVWTLSRQGKGQIGIWSEKNRRESKTRTGGFIKNETTKAQNI